MGVGDTGHWETRTLIGFPLLSPSPLCILLYSGGEWEFWTLWGLAIIALPANTAVTAAVVTDGGRVGATVPTPWYNGKLMGTDRGREPYARPKYDKFLIQFLSSLKCVFFFDWENV